MLGIIWGRHPLQFSRQAVDEAWSLGSRCTCRAKRYQPAIRQRKNSSGANGSRRKTPEPEAADPEDLLRELNSGGVGWLRDEDEQDWGLDDVAEHVRARHERQLHRFGRAAMPSSSVATTGAAADGARAGGRRRGGGRADVADESHGSPLESGLARISTEEDAYDNDGSGSGSDRSGPDRQVVGRRRSGRGGGKGRMDKGMADLEHSSTAALAGAVLAGEPGTAPVETSKRNRTTVELEASYARRNPGVIEALRLRGVVVRVRQSDKEAGNEINDQIEGRERAGTNLDPDAELRDFGFHGDDGLDLLLESDLASTEDGDQELGSSSGSSSITSSRGGDGKSGLGAPSGSRDWYGSLAAAGFAVRTNAAGEVFLERTVRRKATAVPPVTTSNAPTPAAAAAAAVREGIPGREASSAAAATALVAAPQPPLVPPLAPISVSPAFLAALQRLTTPQQVLDFLELSYPHWAANGYRLVDMNSGRPVAAPSPAEAAHCLRAVALTARRNEIGGWRCLEMAAGRQAQGLAEALRVTPPRLLPEQATQQLSAAYFDAAKRFWLESTAANSIIDDPRVRKVSLGGGGGAAAATGSVASVKGALSERRQQGGVECQGAGLTASAAAAAAGDDGADEAEADDGLSVRTPLSYDPVYDSLVAKYTAISKYEKLRDSLRGSLQQLQTQAGQQQAQPPSQLQKRLLVNGHAVPTASAAAAAAVATVQTKDNALLAEQSTNAIQRGAAAPAAAGAVNPTVAETALRRAAKIECLVSALWGMSSLGGPPYFQAETEAAVTILVRCLAAVTAAAASTAAAAPPSGGTEAASTAAAAAPGGLSGWQAGQVLWALGNSRHVTPRLMDLETSILRSGGLSSMQPRDLSRVLWGFASLGYRPERLLLTIRPDWSWRERTNVATVVLEYEPTSPKGRALGKRGPRGGGGGGGRQVVQRGDVRGFTAQQLAGVVWALAVLEQVDTVPFRSAWAQLLRSAADVPPSEPVLTQVWQANLAVHLESSLSPSSSSPSASPSSTATASGRSRAAAAATAAAGNLTTAGLAAAAAAASGGGRLDLAAARSLLLRSRDVFLAATSGLRRKVQSGYQRQIANTLTGLRLMHLLEDNSAGYSIDITLPQLRIALEADGPTHTSRTPGGAVLGATAMKRRHLQKMGWHVVNVTYKEWDKLTSESARRAFLQERMNDALLSRIQLGDEDEENGEEENRTGGSGDGGGGKRRKEEDKAEEGKES